MIVGFDAYHCAKRKGNSVGAMVATTSDTHAKYFSTISYHQNKDDLSDKMGSDFASKLIIPNYYLSDVIVLSI